MINSGKKLNQSDRDEYVTRGEFHDTLNEALANIRDMFHEGMEVQRKYIDNGFKRLEKIFERHMGKNEMDHLKFEERLDRLEEGKSTV